MTCSPSGSPSGHDFISVGHHVTMFGCPPWGGFYNANKIIGFGETLKEAQIH